MNVRLAWGKVLSRLPLIPILRGVTPGEAPGVAALLQQAGFHCLEVPLNSPDPLASIRLLRDTFDGMLMVGAGTVITVSQVDAVHAAGAEFVVSPNANPAVIRATKACGLVSLPGIATPTEAFAAIDAGADALKMFPAEAATPPVLRALKSVLPSEVPILPVGGITPEAMARYVEAGAAGFGIGSGLYRPGRDHDRIRDRANSYIMAWRNIRADAAI